MRKLLLLLFVFTGYMLYFCGELHAQDLTGIWQGHFRNTNVEARSMLFDDRYKFEVQIAQHDKKFEAITYSYLSSIFYGKAEAAGTVNVRTGKVLLQEGRLIEVRMVGGGGPCVMTCFLQYSKSGDEEFLEGSFGSMNVKDSSNCGRGTIFLRKVSSSDFYIEPFVAKREKEIEEEKNAPKKAEPSRDVVKETPKPVKSPARTTARPPAKPPARTLAKTPAKRPPSSAHPSEKPVTKNNTHPGKPAVREPTLARVDPGKAATGAPQIRTDAGIQDRVDAKMIPNVLVSRSNELVRTITVNANEITLSIYDDGVIDHDTVSVFVDKQMVVAHRMLTDKAIVVKLHLDETRSTHEVIMVADNEGDIPPNTSLMIVKAGDQQYEVRISSNEQKNAVVMFKYDKNK